MTLLLDTNALIWSLANADKLGPRAAHDISSSTNQVYISNVSLLECAIKVRTGKLEITMDFSMIDTFLNQANIQLIPFDAWTAAEYVKLPQLSWADPFDTAIIAQAIAKRMTLVTSDHNIIELVTPGLRTFDAKK
jgi:PIN domain nuclease of toxin-antitoxin system